MDVRFLTAVRYWADRFPGRRPEHFAFPACENGKIDPTRGIANWRTAWRGVARSIECPACGEMQSPRKKCRNVECGGSIANIKSPLEGLRFHDLRHSTATKLLEQGTPFPVDADILGWSASTAIRMAKRYGTASGTRGRGDGNSGRCEPICAPTPAWVRIEIA